MSKLDIGKIDRRAFENDFLINKLSISELSKKYSLCPSSVNKVIAEWDLHREMNHSRAQKIADAKRKKYEDLRQGISRDDLFDFYLTQNHSYQECLEHYGVKANQFDKILSDYDLKKDPSLRGKKAVATKYEKAGGKEIYVKQVSEKQRDTIIKKYGSTDIFYAKRLAKMQNTNIERYGYPYKIMADLVNTHSEQYLRVWESKEESITFLKSFIEPPTLLELAKILNCSLNCLHLWIEKYDLNTYIKSTKSHYEAEVAEFVSNLGFEVSVNDRKTISNFELDIYIPEKRLAIEFNGDYWHSENKVGRKYHFKKSKLCEDAGIRLIHIYQYQWEDPIKQEIIKSIIRNALGTNKCIHYARKCEVKELTQKDVVEFSNRNSLHGHRNASVYLGLFYNGELVELMSFGKAFFSRDGSIDYECIRSITRLNTTVVGGMNKLFTYFVRKWNPNKILYYVDYNTHIGNSMNNLGFEFESYSGGGIMNVSNSKEVTEKYGKIFNRKPLKNKEIQQYVKEGKVLPIYDAGVKRYIWKAKN